MVMTVEVYDEAEQAEMLERAEREASEASIRALVFQGTKEEAALMAVEGKECEECGDVIPTERQIASPLSAYCASCQAWVEETTKRRKLLSA
jgi:RNA polymerase-binding transcription factor DksA